MNIKMFVSLAMLVALVACNEGSETTTGSTTKAKAKENPAPPTPETNQQKYAGSMNKLVTQNCYDGLDKVAPGMIERSSKDCTDEDMGKMATLNEMALKECGKGHKGGTFQPLMNLLYPLNKISEKCGKSILGQK